MVKDISHMYLLAENRFTKETVKAPSNALVLGLRRPARTDKMDLTGILDYVIISNFENAGKFVNNPQILEKWKNYVESRLSYMLISRRFDISARGTNLLAFCSTKPATGVDMWNIKGVLFDDAAVLTLWFNSGLNLTSLLVYRTETRGAWMKLHEYMLKDLLILDQNKLTTEERNLLLEVFSREVPFPSILKQLRDRFWARVEIGKAILKVLGFNETETNQLLDYLYPALAKEIEQLKP